MKTLDVVLLIVTLVFAVDALNRNTRNMIGVGYLVLAFGAFNLIVQPGTPSWPSIIFHSGCAGASLIAMYREHKHAEFTGSHFRILR